MDEQTKQFQLDILEELKKLTKENKEKEKVCPTCGRCLTCWRDSRCWKLTPKPYTPWYEPPIVYFNSTADSEF